MYQEVLKKRNGYRVLGGAIVAVGFLSLGLLPAEASTESQYTVLKSQLESAQLLLAQIQPTGAVLGASTTATVVPVRPACRITFDKSIYKLGEPIRVSWTSTGVRSAVFLADTSGKDTLALQTQQTFNGSGSITIPARVFGSPSVFMKMTSSTGHEVVCGRIITIIDSTLGAKDVQIARLQTTLINLVKQGNVLQDQLAALVQRSHQNTIDQLATQIKISNLTSTSSTPDGTARPEVYPVSLSSDVTVRDGVGNDTVTYTMKYEVTAIDDDVYIPASVVRPSASSSFAGAVFQITGASASTSAKGVVSVVLTSTADREAGNYVVQEGETETMVVTATFDPSVSGLYRAGLLRINWATAARGKLMPFELNPAADFWTDSKYLD